MKSGHYVQVSRVNRVKLTRAGLYLCGWLSQLKPFAIFPAPRKMVRYNCYVHYSQFILSVNVMATGVKPHRPNMLSTGHKH